MMIYILFVTKDNYEKSKRGETVSGQVILNKTLYKYDMQDHVRSYDALT